MPAWRRSLRAFQTLISTAIDALTRGARGFLYKPFTDEQLVDALLEIIN
jgi:FixJ family two-component response regulator